MTVKKQQQQKSSSVLAPVQIKCYLYKKWNTSAFTGVTVLLLRMTNNCIPSL